MARKKFKKKTSARAAARKRGGSIYKVKGGWSITKARRKKRRR